MILVGAFATTSSWGEDSPVYGHYFGFAGGTSTGNGLSYRSWPDTFGLQVTVLPVVTNTAQYGSVGITGLWTLSDLQWTKFFTYLGASTEAGRSDGVRGWDGRAALAAGIGFEFLWFDHIAFDLMAGYGLQANYPKTTTFGTTFSVESGLFYRTKL